MTPATSVRRPNISPHRWWPWPTGPAPASAPTRPIPSGSYGYDISRFQDNPPTCNQTLPSGHIIGIVEATGAAGSAANPCLAHEAAWAGAGLNLYIYMTYGTSTTAEPGCGSPADQACNFGYQAGQYAYNYAQLVGREPPGHLVARRRIGPQLDVRHEPRTPRRSRGPSTPCGASASTTSGIYASPDTWNSIVGDYQPAVPLWVAWWSGNGGAWNCQHIATLLPATTSCRRDRCS